MCMVRLAPRAEPALVHPQPRQWVPGMHALHGCAVRALTTQLHAQPKRLPCAAGGWTGSTFMEVWAFA